MLKRLTPKLMVEDVNHTLYIEVAGLQDLYGQLRGAVDIVELHTTFYGAQEFYFRDINGYIF